MSKRGHMGLKSLFLQTLTLTLTISLFLFCIVFLDYQSFFVLFVWGRYHELVFPMCNNMINITCLTCVSFVCFCMCMHLCVSVLWSYSLKDKSKLNVHNYSASIVALCLGLFIIIIISSFSFLIIEFIIYIQQLLFLFLQGLMLDSLCFFFVAILLIYN